MRQKYKLTAGDTLIFKRKAEGFDGFTGTLRIVPRATTGSVVTATGTHEGDEWTFKIADTSALFGDYTFFIYFDTTSEHVSFEEGDLVVAPNPRTAAAGYDPRSKWQIELDAALELLRNWDSMGKFKKYKIGDREIEYGTQSELLSRIRFLRAMVARDEGRDLKMPYDIKAFARNACL